jgi:serine/threonine-protein kinase
VPEPSQPQPAAGAPAADALLTGRDRSMSGWGAVASRVERAVHPLKPGDAFYYFTVERALGEGHNGAVYEIVHKQTGDRFALKTMWALDVENQRKVARALASAKGHYRIDHKNVVRVFDLNCESNGMVWMRTELLRGHTFAELLARQRRLSIPFALAAATEVAFGLAEMHASQIVHRDVKPSNLFYTEARAVKVLDFGLAKVFAEGFETTQGSRVGLGSLAYSAPEQLEGHPPDPRFDVHGLGITLWEMLAGRHPDADLIRRNDLTELTKRRLTVMPPSLVDVAGIPAEIDQVVRRAILKDPGQRYGSMMEMARALMDAGAWVATEARAGRLDIIVPPGEPPLPGDTSTWRDYRAPQATPSHEAPPSGPRERVLIAPAAQPPASWVPSSPSPPGGGKLAATVPLDEVVAIARAMKQAAPPEPTPPAVAHSRVPAPAAKARTSWLVVLAGVAVAAMGAAGAVGWWTGRHPPPAPVPPAPAVTASPPATATATGEVQLVPEEPATASATPVVSASPGPSAAPRRGPVRTPGPAVISPAPLPPPTAKGALFRSQ